MKSCLIFFLPFLMNFCICRDFYIGMFKKNDFIAAQDNLYKERIPHRFARAKYGRLLKCSITYIRVIDRLGIGRGPRVQIIRGGLGKKYVVLRLTSPYNNPISVNIYIGCENKIRTSELTRRIITTTETVTVTNPISEPTPYATSEPTPITTTTDPPMIKLMLIQTRSLIRATKLIEAISKSEESTTTTEETTTVTEVKPIITFTTEETTTTTEKSTTITTELTMTITKLSTTTAKPTTTRTKPTTTTTDQTTTRTEPTTTTTDQTTTRTEATTTITEPTTEDTTVARRTRKRVLPRDDQENSNL